MSSNKRGFTFLDHEGEMGVFCWGVNLEELFRAAAEGLYTLMRSSFTLIDSVETDIEMEEEEVDLLLRAFLAELVFYESAERLIFPHFEFLELTPTRMRCKAMGGHYDPQKEPLEREIKAVTYHQLMVRREQDRWIAQYIVDV